MLMLHRRNKVTKQREFDLVLDRNLLGDSVDLGSEEARIYCLYFRVPTVFLFSQVDVRSGRYDLFSFTLRKRQAFCVAVL